MYFAAAKYTSSHVNCQFLSIVGIAMSFPWRNFSEATLSFDVLRSECISSWKKNPNKQTFQRMCSDLCI